MNQSTTEKIQRRAFIKGTAISGAALGAGLISVQSAAEVSVEKPATTVAKKGYRETRHIREYYKAARF